MHRQRVLVTGATGYVGGRLVPQLLAAGYRVRALARSLDKLQARPWAGHPAVELMAGDTRDLAALRRAVDGCDAAYYLVHSMISGARGFADADRRSALNMAAASAAAGLGRIIYLGGLGELGDPTLSPHLRSRHHVGEILHAGPVPTTELRAAMILGAGSASFEILRYLVERLPVMITPRWVQTPCQPIAISTVLAYLQGCLEHPETAGQRYDIGDDQVLTYRDLIAMVAEEAGLRPRLILPLPILTPRLSAYWIHLVTPVPASIAMPLTEGLGVPVVCRDERLRQIVPVTHPSCRETIRLALRGESGSAADTCWSDAGCVLPPEWVHCGDAAYSGGTILSCGYRIELAASPGEIWRAVATIGGDKGYYAADYLWQMRGLMDRLVGGYGLRRGRRHPDELRAGDALDFWRVLEARPERRLRLLAEMRVPGEAVLDFEIDSPATGRARLQMLSRFRPRGMAGMAYWWVLYPFHEAVFHAMLKAIARAIGRPVLTGPTRFTPALPQRCRL
jgi:uncharacterized protein YbjT (DUF2867 family)